MASAQRSGLLPGVENRRVGRVIGDDGGERIVRTFHARFGSVKLNSGTSPRSRLAYVFREGKHRGERGDVEASAGDKDRLLAAADRIAASATVRRGPRAERILATQIVELPAESTARQRAACAQAFVDDWTARGHEAVAVVHVHGEEQPQPHLHVEIAARPVDAAGTVDRSVRIWQGRPSIYAERSTVADIVNRTCRPEPPYHPGGFRDIGVERAPKRRIPPRPFRAGRAEIRAALAAGDADRAGEIEGEVYAVSRSARAEIRAAAMARREEIAEFQAAGLPPRPSRRRRLVLVEACRLAEDALRRATAAEERVAGLEATAVRPIVLTVAQRSMLEDVCARHRIAGELGDAQVQLRAFAALHEEREARKKGRPPAGPYATATEAELRQAWRKQGLAIRLAGRDLEEMAPDHAERAVRVRDHEAARSARSELEAEAKRRGIGFESRRPGRTKSGGHSR